MRDTHWALNKSRRGSANTRSVRNIDSNEPTLVVNVGGESSERLWYDLEMISLSPCIETASAYLTAASAAKFAAQQMVRIRPLSSVSQMCFRYGFEFAASDLWKLANKARSNEASKANCSVSGDLIIWKNVQARVARSEMPTCCNNRGKQVSPKKICSRTELANSANEHHSQLENLVSDRCYNHNKYEINHQAEMWRAWCNSIFQDIIHHRDESLDNWCEEGTRKIHRAHTINTWSLPETAPANTSITSNPARFFCSIHLDNTDNVTIAFALRGPS